MSENYQPEFVSRFLAWPEACCCPACLSNNAPWPLLSHVFTQQTRVTLNLNCERAAHEIMFNPAAFVLHHSVSDAQSDDELTLWEQSLNQQCINLAIHPALSHEERLYAIGILLSKAQHYIEQRQQDKPELLSEMGEQLGLLACKGILAEQLSQLPLIEKHQIDALSQMGSLRLKLNQSEMNKIGLMLKLSELAVLPASRLSERLHTLKNVWLDCPRVINEPHILRNLLLYKLYSYVFPGRRNTHYGKSFLNISRYFFQLKMLFSMWMEEHGGLTDDALVTLVSAWYQWQSQCPDENDVADVAEPPLLVGFSLL